jgi:hypothetical protein
VLQNIIKGKNIKWNVACGINGRDEKCKLILVGKRE